MRQIPFGKVGPQHERASKAAMNIFHVIAK